MTSTCSDLDGAMCGIQEKEQQSAFKSVEWCLLPSVCISTEWMLLVESIIMDQHREAPFNAC